MKIRVLGSGAGGGFPQWNCNCTNCSAIRSGQLQGLRRTQSSICVSADERKWVLFNASPDIRAQLDSFPPLHPQTGLRDSGIGALILIDSQIDHATGLLMLRESNVPLELYASSMVQQDLTTGLPILTLLEHYCGVRIHTIPLDGTAFTIAGIPDLQFTAHALKSKAPPYSPHRHDPHPGDNIGVTIMQVSSGHRAYYAPGLAEIEPHVADAMRVSDAVLVDGTFWRNDEMAVSGITHKLALDMGHLPQSGPGGMIEFLDSLPKPRKILIHINNTNPILNEASAERETLRQHGIEVAYDGLEIVL